MSVSHLETSDGHHIGLSTHIYLGMCWERQTVEMGLSPLVGGEGRQEL